MNPLTTSTVAGGSAGGILSTCIHVISMPLSVLGLPNLPMILNTVVLAFIGATVGYFTKLVWDKIFDNKKPMK
jgi:hypothetical protein